MDGLANTQRKCINNTIRRTYVTHVVIAGETAVETAENDAEVLGLDMDYVTTMSIIHLAFTNGYCLNRTRQ